MMYTKTLADRMNSLKERAQRVEPYQRRNSDTIANLGSAFEQVNKILGSMELKDCSINSVGRPLCHRCADLYAQEIVNLIANDAVSKEHKEHLLLLLDARPTN